MTLHQFLVILQARWRFAVSVFFGVIAVVLVVSLIWPKQYMGVASVVVDNKTDPVSVGANAAAVMGQPANNYVNTQADIIASERVAQRVVKMLKLDQQPEARKRWATGSDDDISVQIADFLLDKKVVVAPSHDSPTHASNVIDISVNW